MMEEEQRLKNILNVLLAKKRTWRHRFNNNPSTYNRQRLEQAIKNFNDAKRTYVRFRMLNDGYEMEEDGSLVYIPHDDF